LGQFIVLSIL